MCTGETRSVRILGKFLRTRITMEIHWCEVHCQPGPSIRIFNDGIMRDLINHQVSHHLKKTFEKVHVRNFTSKLSLDGKFDYHVWRIGDNLRDLLYYLERELSLPRKEIDDYVVSKVIYQQPFQWEIIQKDKVADF